MSTPPPETLKLYPAPHPGAGIERLGERLLAATPDDHLHQFLDDDGTPSHSAERILALCDGSRTVEMIANQLATEFSGASAEQVLADVAEFVALLAQKQVLALHDHPL